VPKLPAGQYVLTAIYAGDLTYGPGTSNTLAFAVEDFTITCNPNSLTIVQGQTGQASCTIISAGGLTGPIQAVCTQQDPPQTGAIVCSFPPPGIVNGTGTMTLTVVTTKGNLAANQQLQRPGQRPGQPPGKWPAAAASGGIALAFASLLLSPIGRHARILRSAASRTFLALVLMIGLACANIGCSNTVTTRISTGTPLGIATLQISAAAFVNTVTVTHTTYVTVNVIP
jgi:hypothetical protein